MYCKKIHNTSMSKPHPSENDSVIKKISIDIGKFLDIPMWEALSDEEKSSVMSNDRDSAPSDYYVMSLSDFKGLPLVNIICYDPYCGLLSRGSQAAYSFNLKTCRPTKNSPIQDQLPKELIKKIKDNVDDF